ncbi:hypothetical protein GWI33_004552 [Rhynchophorus ferrugineus]|uniref:Uncharacterized protein n=1 Tax=Rhynchophorus ferrugineus TaxID=354439 RepID=A0A834MEI9_RHYFE|nr:hypothetical protein GWI33_004552 [Rhynchophorus ferrugineus]
MGGRKSSQELHGGPGRSFCYKVTTAVIESWGRWFLSASPASFPDSPAINAIPRPPTAKSPITYKLIG